jgi:uncharacterized protein YacL
MSPVISRIIFVILFLGAATLYQASFMDLGWDFLAALAITGLFGFLIAQAVKQTLRFWSAVNTLNALISSVIGFGVASFFALCSKELFAQCSLPPAISSFFFFLLPFSIAVISFESLKAFAFFQSEASAQYTDSPRECIAGNSATRKFIPDQAVLEDGRIVDLARTGLFDGQIVIPNFLPKELKSQSENGDETSKTKARKALEALKRLESLPRIGIQFKDVSVPEISDLNDKVLHSAKALNASLLTNENSPLRTEAEQGLYLAIDTIANSLRPPIPKGEMLSIKIQRLGKEPKQGIGYLDDGTMVVVNGGGDFLGKNVRTQVLSQKYSSSGKIVFCNVKEEEESDDRSLALSYGHPDGSYYSSSSSL